MSTTKCVGAATLSETHGVLHGAQIPETAGVATQADCLTTADFGPGVIELAFLTVNHVHQGSTPLQRAPTAPLCSTPRNGATAESIDELRALAGGRDDILAEAACIEVGSWYASPATHIGHELGAGMLIMAGGGNCKPLDDD
jgi:hypothetical protein